MNIQHTGRFKKITPPPAPRHVVDSPSFPLASAAYPELAREGSWTRSNATIYGAEQVGRLYLLQLHWGVLHVAASSMS